MENNGDLYEDLLKMKHMVDIIYAYYQEKMEREEREKERAEDNARVNNVLLHHLLIIQMRRSVRAFK